MIPKMKGYTSVKEAEERESVLLQLAESKQLLDEQEHKPKSNKKVRVQRREVIHSQLEYEK